MSEQCVPTLHASTPLREALGEASGNLLELRLKLLAERTFPVNLVKQIGLV